MRARRDPGTRRRALLLLLTVVALCSLPIRADEPAITSGSPQPLASVIPAPRLVTRGHGTLRITAATRLEADDAAALPAARYLAQLARVAPGIVLEPRLTAAVRGGGIRLRLEPDLESGPEGYTLDTGAAGATIRARDPRGLLYGAITFWELLSGGSAGPHGAMLPALHIEDGPRFPWRGLMLDSARHFQSVDFILRYLDWMAVHKLNVFSWHLTDDQGWRLQVPKYPRLTAVGAFRVPAGRAARSDLDPATHEPRKYGGFYTEADVRRIVAHAAELNITVVPEIDLPGHTTAALVAYPQLAAAPQQLPREVPADWGIYSHVLNLDEATFGFVEDVLSQVLALFPGPYVHVGGDEVVSEEWRDSPAVRSRMQALGIAEVKDVQGYFERRLEEYLRQHGRRLVGWDEILAAGLGPDATVMSWRGVAGAQAAVRAGHDAVLSPDPVLYFDHRQGGSPGEPPGRGAIVSLADVYRFDPEAGALAGGGTHLLGLQGNLWSEHVRTGERAAIMTFPRAAALAERAWTGAQAPGFEDFRSRLPDEFARYRALGIPFSRDEFAPPRHLGPFDRHMSQDLAPCTSSLLLNLEDDAPVQGPRAVFLLDIMNPCWLMNDVDLSGPMTLTAAVGQLPFNFQIGKDREAIHLDPARGAAGELEVRIDDCAGPVAATLDLAPAVDDDAVTVLAATPLPVVAGATHRLCFRFAQHGLDPLWALDWVELGR